MAHLGCSESCPGELEGDRLVVGVVQVERWQLVKMSKPLSEAQGRCAASFQPLTNGTCSYIGRQLLQLYGTLRRVQVPRYPS